jgi:signal transduction histidine kinase
MDYMDVDIVNLMKQVRLEMEDQIADSNLLFRWNLPDEKVILRLDGQKTYRVFSNLINNIVKYSMPNSRVYIDIKEENEFISVHSKNISQTELDFDVNRLTERFVRGDVSRNTEGSGLGLDIAKSFVELQNGTFKIDVDGDLFKVMITWSK